MWRETEPRSEWLSLVRVKRIRIVGPKDSLLIKYADHRGVNLIRGNGGNFRFDVLNDARESTRKRVT